jgi:Transposase DDE domain
MCARITSSERRLSDRRAEKVGCARFFRNENVTVQELIATAAARTAQAAEGRHVVLIEDTTEINYQAKAGRKKQLGTVGNGSDLGLFVHPAFALDAQDGSVLGLSGATIWRRTKKKQKNYQSLPIEQKESYRWIDTALWAAEGLKNAACITEVKDREGDIYEVFARERAPNVKLLVRANHDRALADEGRLFALVSAQDEAGRAQFELSARPGREGRKVTLAVRFTAARLRQPKNGADAHDAKSVSINIVDVCEVDPPSRKDAIRWRLLTTHDVESVADAMRIVELYRLRWAVEQLFRTIKSQAFDLEESFVEDGDALERLAVTALIAATRVMQLVHARGDAGRRYRATRIFGPEDINVLHALVKTLEGKTLKQKNPHPSETLAWAAWSIARLGGWNGYAKERPPGPITFARGLQRFHAIAQGFALAKLGQSA